MPFPQKGYLSPVAVLGRWSPAAYAADAQPSNGLMKGQFVAKVYSEVSSPERTLVPAQILLGGNPLSMMRSYSEAQLFFFAFIVKP